jgi:hypothetical protein
MQRTHRASTPRRARVSRRNDANRRWCIPPALLREPDELLEGAGVLAELPGEAGLALWQSLRDVTLWAAVEPERRAGLFAGDAAGARLRLLRAAEAEPALELALATLAALVGNPAAASAEIVTLVCLQVSRWAGERGKAATAVGFAQCAALATPDDPCAALEVGRAALRWGQGARAETWLRRTVGLARRARDWSAYAEAWVELARLHHRRGAGEASRRAYVRGVRAARRHGLVAVRGAGLHGLFLLAVEAGEPDEAERLARAAVRSYGRAHPAVPGLLLDLGRLWVGEERWERAVPLLQRLAAAHGEERGAALALLARAAAGAGDRAGYQAAWSEAWSLAAREGDAAAGPLLLELARAAAALRDWPRLEQAAREVLVSPRRPDPAVAAQVEALVAAARRRPR